jgi:hypothetical protein
MRKNGWVWAKGPGVATSTAGLIQLPRRVRRHLKETAGAALDAPTRAPDGSAVAPGAGTTRIPEADLGLNRAVPRALH